MMESWVTSYELRVAGCGFLLSDEFVPCRCEEVNNRRSNLVACRKNGDCRAPFGHSQ